MKENFADDLREKLNKRVLMYGTKDKKTIELSQKLDLYMVQQQKDIMNRKYGRTS